MNLLTDKEAAATLRVSVDTVKRLRLTGVLGYTKIGRLARITDDQLQEYIERSKRPKAA